MNKDAVYGVNDLRERSRLDKILEILKLRLLNLLLINLIKIQRVGSKRLFWFKHNEKYKAIRLLIINLFYTVFNQIFNKFSIFFTFFFLRAILTTEISEIPEINPVANNKVFYQSTYFFLSTNWASFG